MKRQSCFHWITFAPLSKISGLHLHGAISEFSIHFNWPMCLFLQQSWLLYQYNVLKLCVVITQFILLFQNYFSYSSSFVFPYKILNNLVYIYKKYYLDFDRNCIKPEYQFGESWHFKILSHPIHDHGITFIQLTFLQYCSFQHANPMFC